MSVLRWLHLSDFHQGMSGQGWLWPNMRELFYEDLAKLHARSGPWDLVLFTGDLTQRGSAQEFARFEETMSDLFAHLRVLGSEPEFLFVPGNHDLSRPKSNVPAVKVLERWREDAEVQKEFWRNAASPYRKVVKRAFTHYEKWLRESRLPRPSTLKHGLLPGDFSATIKIKKADVRLGILGLNTAFLQLTGGHYQGRLSIGPAQFHASCDEDGPGWARSHDACLLLSHHPPDWLDEDAQRVLRGEISPPGRFVAHLFGHMHEGGTKRFSVGGRESWCDVQAPSLFGLEHWGTSKETRQHGYSIGQLEFTGEHGV
ncbi:MAG TPA: metallophosphoesterase, partial [Archangium sp.]|nr:metallophosphoesterase [Archangium sp.]